MFVKYCGTISKQRVTDSWMSTSERGFGLVYNIICHGRHIEILIEGVCVTNREREKKREREREKKKRKRDRATQFSGNLWDVAND